MHTYHSPSSRLLVYVSVAFHPCREDHRTEMIVQSLLMTQRQLILKSQLFHVQNTFRFYCEGKLHHAPSTKAEEITSSAAHDTHAVVFTLVGLPLVPTAPGPGVPPLQGCTHLGFYLRNDQTPPQTRN